MEAKLVRVKHKVSEDEKKRTFKPNSFTKKLKKNFHNHPLYWTLNQDNKKIKEDKLVTSIDVGVQQKQEKKTHLKTQKIVRREDKKSFKKSNSIKKMNANKNTKKIFEEMIFKDPLLTPIDIVKTKFKNLKKNVDYHVIGSEEGDNVYLEHSGIYLLVHIPKIVSPPKKEAKHLVLRRSGGKVVYLHN